ncbi:MAG: hypothetical protein ACJA1J_003565 [Sulfitobacter pontiacus]|jgi:hypothetical protein
MCVCFNSRFARPEQANGPTGRGRRMKRRDRFAPQNRPERNPAERPGRDVLARRSNRDAGCDAAVRPHGRMRDGPKGRSPLRHAKPSREAARLGLRSMVECTKPTHSACKPCKLSGLLKGSDVEKTLSTLKMIIQKEQFDFGFRPTNHRSRQEPRRRGR